MQSDTIKHRVEVRTLFIMLRAVLEGSNKQMLFIFGRRNCAIKYLVEDYIIPLIYMLQQCEKKPSETFDKS